MTTPKAKDPLDALQLLVNDVLVQTGKALRASRRDSQGNLPPFQGALQPKLPDTIRAFHSALDDLEHDIIRAKSVLLRDLNRLKAQNHSSDESRSLPPPQQVESQSKSPMAIEIDSSPQAVLKEEPIDSDLPGSKLGGAPIPDMGMGLGLGLGMADATHPAVPIKDENVSQQASNGVHAGIPGAIKSESKESKPEAPVATMDLLDGNQANMGGSDGAALDLTNSDLNFTDMEFTLAPTNNSQNQPGHEGNATASNHEPSFDLASFDTTDGATGTLSSLENMLPTNNATMQSAPATTNASEARPADSQPNAERQKKASVADQSLADVFTGDGQADGMDFDFSLGDGMGGDTFDDLMNDRDNTFDTMEHGDFDANFFGLDKIDDS
ncbi:hypothetical protein ED733_006154 [Metarhizium rileyi]|uniref:Uncharacterized protein n=1 Tax=Metarhizium rileyi (strain RCEF 4871) TaxID=1649241 RepID=A0A5C6GDA3_METRR|nr:hypothetical protein ED733_006154 [Metarhizium rileyi]